MEMRTKLSGPVFDGAASRVLRSYQDAAEAAIADQGVNDVRAELGRVLEHPTGYYQAHIQTDRARGDMAVTDGGVVYGPWLEGTSSRNKSTRFKGYRTFRRVRQRLQGKAPAVAERILSRYIGRLS